MIRIATTDDIPAILAIYAPYILNTAYTFEYEVPTVDDFTRRFLHHTQQCPWLVWEEEGAVLGYAYGSLPFERAAYRWCAEVSIYLSPKIQGRGIGKKLYAVLEDILFRQGYRVIYSIISSENTGSVAFHEKLGYKTVAKFPDCGIKFGRSLGTIWLEKRSELVDFPTKTPCSWLSIVENNRKF